MKKSILTLIILIFSLGISAIAENPEIFVEKSSHDFATSVELLKKAAKDVGWTIPNEHDMQANMKKGGHDVLPIQILVLCNSGFAQRLLDNDDTRHIAAVMPCRIAVYQKEDNSTYIAWSNLLKLGEKLGEPAQSILKDVAKEMNQIAQSAIR